jgi:hypothetical protein
MVANLPAVWCGVAIGILWMGAFAIHGMSSVFLGVLGTSAGWALFQFFMIMRANCSGLLTAEWRGAPGRLSGAWQQGLCCLLPQRYGLRRAVSCKDLEG